MKAIKQIITSVLALVVGVAANGAPVATVSGLHLEGEVKDGMLQASVAFRLDNVKPGGSVPVLGGGVAIVSKTLPAGMKLLPPAADGLYRIAAEPSFWGRGRSGDVELAFTTARGEGVTLDLPVATVRTFEIRVNPQEWDVSVAHAGNLEAVQTDGPPPARVIRGNLPAGRPVEVRWRSAAMRFQRTDAIVSCRAETTSLVAPGVIRHTSVFTYKITQGTVRRYAFRVPKQVNIVSTDADFNLLKQEVGESDSPAYSTLTLTPQVESAGARITLVYEDALPAFPCKTVIEPVAPVGVLRTEGLLTVVPSGAIRIQPGAMTNLLQTAAAASAASASALSGGGAYRYTATPCSLEVGLEDIVTAVHSENTVVVRVEDALASVEALLQLDLRDAPADQVVAMIGKAEGWTITSASGRGVADGDIEQRKLDDGALAVTIPFRKPVAGMMKVVLKMERRIDTAAPGTLAVPEIAVQDAVVQNGYVIAAASQGIQLAPEGVANLSEIHAASTPLNVPGAQLAFRFRGDAWSVALGYTRAKTAIHSELFHLVSPGDGMLYASAAATYHISGAPTDTFSFKVPAHLKQVDVTCADMDGWTRTGDTLVVKLARRILGDWTLLVSYEQQLDYHGGELAIGEIETIGTTSEMGFIVLAGPAALQAEEAGELPPTMIRIGKDEIPEGYAASLLSPVTAAWKYMRAPHTARIALVPLATKGSIGQVVDFLAIESKITRDGASVTTARYSVKNARGQYLALKLPAGATLWTVGKVLEGGRVESIPSQFDQGLLLVPVERPRDPNTATTVEIQYAVDNAATPSRQTLEAPVLVDTPVTFAEWRLVAGDKLAVRRASGNLSPDAAGGGRRFTRTSVMPGDAPLALTFSVVPAWLARVNLPAAIICGALALFFLVLAIARRGHRFWIACTFVATGALLLNLGAVSFEDATIMGFGLLLLLFLLGVLRIVARGLWSLATYRPARPPQEAAGVEPPPLVAAAEAAKAAPQPRPEAGREGSTRTGLAVAMGLLAGAALAAAPAALDYRGEFHSSNAFVSVWSDDIAVDVVPPEKDLRAGATMRVTRRIDCTFDQPGAYSYPRFADGSREEAAILEAAMPSGVRLGYARLVELEGDGVRVQPEHVACADGGLVLFVEKAGRHALRFTIGSTTPGSVLRTKTFGAVTSAATVTMPKGELEAAPARLYGGTMTVRDDGAQVFAGHLAAGEDALEIKIAPKRRDVEKEAVVMSADVATCAAIRSGVVDVTTVFRYRVLQGVVRQVRVRIPETLHVVDVAGDAGDWSFDPATRILTAAVKPATPDGFSLAVRCNAVAKNFPYESTVVVPEALDVERQNGRLGVAASEAVLLTLVEHAGCSVMRNEDFGAVEPPWAGAAGGAGEPVRRAFRYDEARKVAVTLAADMVKPELRSTLNLAMSVGDERYTASAQLELSVAKAGVFSVNLEMPGDYVIETITGDKMVGWDDRRKGGGGVEVMFGGALEGVCPLYVVLSKQRQGVDPEIAVPRIAVKGAIRQTGRIAVTAERGVKLALDAHDGVVAARGDDGQATAKHAVALDILRVDWSAVLKTQVLDPVVKPDVLHGVSIAEGMLQHRVYLRCKIENAGVKQFRVVVPAKGASLTVSGRHIARVAPEGEPAADGAQAWLIELQGKVDGEYAATCFYQEPYDSTQAVEVKPLRVVAAARQTGWMVVSGDVRIKVDAEFSPTTMRPEDARTIPDIFGAGDLSGALKCWKVLDPDAAVALKVTRHAAAEVLPATVERMEQTTVLSIGGRALTQTDLTFSVGRLRFLRFTLPGPEGDLWTAQVNGRPVTVSKEAGGEALCIPLDSVPEGDVASVSFVWAFRPATSFGGRLTLEAPRFPDLPLRNIDWTLFAPEGWRYTLRNEDFDLAPKPGARADGGWMFDSTLYQSRNQARSSGQLTKAKVSLQQVGQMLDEGQRGRAQRELKQVIALSQADASMNEDARVQFESVAVQNANIGFINRRGALRTYNNIFDADPGAQQRQAVPLNGGNFSREFAQQVEERLSARDRQALQMVSAKIVGQQAAADETPAAIAVTMPEHGCAMRFTRALQTQLGGGMAIELGVRRSLASRLGLVGETLQTAVAAVVAVPVLWIALLFAFGRKRREC
ncbi:MAG: hypothetical protein ACOX9C_00965 [Kiritimatiellia bacterium]|jgi:hypothetical protein